MRKRTGTTIGSLFMRGVSLHITSGFVKMKSLKVETIREEYYFRRYTGEGGEIKL